jgi:hypothetical protein
MVKTMPAHGGHHAPRLRLPECGGRAPLTVDSFIWKRGMSFGDIYGCYYHPTWIIGNRAKSLSIVPKRGIKKREIQLATNHFYFVGDIADIIYEIKNRNPNVELDRSAIDLMDGFGY